MYSVFGPNIIIQMYDINRRIYTLWLQSERQISQGKSNCCKQKNTDSIHLSFIETGINFSELFFVTLSI